MITISTKEATDIFHNRMSCSLQELILPRINNNILKVNDNDASQEYALLHYRKNNNQVSLAFGGVLGNVLHQHNSLTITGFLVFTEIAIKHPNINEFILLGIRP